MKRRNAKKNVDDSEESSSEPETSDSDTVYTPAKRRGRPPSKKQKKLRLQNLSDPQPSTSQAHDSSQESDCESGSESADSDYGPVRDKTEKKAPTTKRNKVDPRKSNKSKNLNSSINGVSSQKTTVNGSHLNSSQKKVSKLSRTSDTSLEANLIETLSQRLVYFLLIEDQKKTAIRKRAILEKVFKENNNNKLYTPVLNKANVILKKTFGMELMQLENQKDSYLLINILSRDLNIHDYIELPRIKQQQQGLILFLLTVIYMNENSITEDELTKCLKPMGIDLTSTRLHPVFGDVKKYITGELVKQMYLKYENISKDPPKYEFTWGLRAKQEFDKRDLLQYSCEVMDGEARPEDWKIQFKDAETSAKTNSDG